MALHTQLPIYKVAYDLLDVVTDLVKNMPRDFKRSIGGKIGDECVEIVVLIFRANCARDKAPHLGDLIERLQSAPRWSARFWTAARRRRGGLLGHKHRTTTERHYIRRGKLVDPAK